MSVSPNPDWKQHPMKILGYVGAFLVLAYGPAPAHADGVSDPNKARAICEGWGKADTAEHLKACCSNVILVASMADQRRLEAQCAAGVGSSSSSSSSKPAKPNKPASNDSWVIQPGR